MFECVHGPGFGWVMRSTVGTTSARLGLGLLPRPITWCLERRAWRYQIVWLLVSLFADAGGLEYSIHAMERQTILQGHAGGTRILLRYNRTRNL